MNILIVTAHPSSKSVTNSVASTYAEAKRSKGHTVEMVDLYSKEYKIEVLTFENIRECALSQVQKKFHVQLLWANEIVVVHPIWWGMAPSIMKSWTELAFWPGIAYKYTPEGKVHKLLTGKTAKIFATSGGPSWWFYLPILPLRPFWSTCVFGFSGIDVVDIKICGKLDIYKNEKREKHLLKFLKKIRSS